MELEHFGHHIDVSKPRRFVHLLQAGLLLAVLVASLWSKQAPVSAARLTGRSVTVSTAALSAASQYDFVFDLNSSATVGSIVFEYCENSPLRQFSCDPQPGMDVSAASLTSQYGQTGFSIGSATANTITLTRAPSAVGSGQVEYVFDNNTNPSQAETVFVRISLYASTDGSGSYSDEGAVAFATANTLQVSAYVPPYLIFCAALNIDTNCQTISGYNINLGELSSAAPRYATSQFAGATNATGGFSTYVSGTTMTAGNYEITPITSKVNSITGTGQFGINLRANTVPAVGGEVSGAGTSSSAVGDYDDPNLYKFVSGDLLTQSIFPTDYNVFTVSYVVNIPANQTAGHYATTLTFTALASF